MNCKAIEGSFNSILFVEFIKGCLQKKIVFEGRKLIIVNARIHKSETSFDFLNNNNISFDFLPPYSPQLNHIEEFLAL